MCFLAECLYAIRIISGVKQLNIKSSTWKLIHSLHRESFAGDGNMHIYMCSVLLQPCDYTTLCGYVNYSFRGKMLLDLL